MVQYSRDEQAGAVVSIKYPVAAVVPAAQGKPAFFFNLSGLRELLQPQKCVCKAEIISVSAVFAKFCGAVSQHIAQIRLGVIAQGERGQAWLRYSA